MIKIGNLSRSPFTEMFERVKLELARDDATGATVENQYKGRINDIYMLELPSRIDWKHIEKNAGITGIADYSTGTITSISGTTVTGSSTAWTSANSNNLLFKHDDFDEVYRATYVSATSLTLDRAWIEGSVTAGNGYRLVADRYALASDFDRMAQDINRCVYYWSAGKRIYLDYLTPDQFDEEFSFSYGTPDKYTVKWTDGDPYLFIYVPLDTASNLYYDYIPKLTQLTEYTTGTSSITNGASAVTGVSTDFDGYVTGTDTFYISWDGDGTASSRVWYEVSSASSNTAITLVSAYGGTTKAAGSAHTISKVSLFPPTLDLAIMYKAATASVTSQSNQVQIEVWNKLYEQIVNQYAARETQVVGAQRMRTVYEGGSARR